MGGGDTAEGARERNLALVVHRLIAEDEDLVVEQSLTQTGDNCRIKIDSEVDAFDLRTKGRRDWPTADFGHQNPRAVAI